MALPLPSVVANVGPGGPLVTSMGGMNALNNAMQEAKINAVKAQYAPLTTQAEAASKLAYANLMGPQFLAKLMGNEDILANMSPEQRTKALQMVYGAGSGQGGANALMNNPMMMGQASAQQQSSPFSNLVNSVKNAFGFSSPSQAAQSSNAMLQNPGQQTSPMMGQQGQGADSGYSYDKNGNNIVASPQEVNAAIDKNNVNQDTFAENKGRYAGIAEEGKKLGELRAQAIGDMDDQYQQAVQAEVPIQHLMDISQSPVFMNMRNKVPFFQDKQLQYLSKAGTPEEQKMIGDFTTSATNAVSNTINGFKGRILDKEITMANQMKISPNDTWNTMIGKLASIETFNQMTKQRARIASQLMQDKHLNRGQALEQADKQIDANAIRKSVEAKLNPQPTMDDIDHMASKYNISKEEVIKKLKKKGYKLEIQLSGEK